MRALSEGINHGIQALKESNLNQVVFEGKVEELSFMWEKGAELTTRARERIHGRLASQLINEVLIPGAMREVDPGAFPEQVRKVLDVWKEKNSGNINYLYGLITTHMPDSLAENENKSETDRKTEEALENILLHGFDRNMHFSHLAVLKPTMFFADRANRIIKVLHKDFANQKGETEILQTGERNSRNRIIEKFIGMNPGDIPLPMQIRAAETQIMMTPENAHIPHVSAWFGQLSGNSGLRQRATNELIEWNLYNHAGFVENLEEFMQNTGTESGYVPLWRNFDEITDGFRQMPNALARPLTLKISRDLDRWVSAPISSETDARSIGYMSNILDRILSNPPVHLRPENLLVTEEAEYLFENIMRYYGDNPNDPGNRLANAQMINLAENLMRIYSNEFVKYPKVTELTFNAFRNKAVSGYAQDHETVRSPISKTGTRLGEYKAMRRIINAVNEGGLSQVGNYRSL